MKISLENQPFITDLTATEKIIISHVIDEQAYGRLVGELGFGYQSAMRIVGFWKWLEICVNSNIVAKTFPLPNFIVRELAKEAIWCMKFLQTGMPPLPYYSDEFQLLFTTRFLGSEFSLSFLRENVETSESAMAKIDRFAEDACKNIDQVMFGVPSPTLMVDETQQLIMAQLCAWKSFWLLN
ncbi:hypothetical protein L484_011209 [Morus notabilis]|uniref:Uncharacterized protein n=1 Tax=Morus notabilis TaxID=981085 RepID=W9SAN5_9ROSA|nr:hypothetical protein L484_011209 [Morus notabilis]